MRKLMSKKGFTLVELMIVVVILGILVAVAVPIFNSVTKNARKKSCQANMRVIKGNLEQYQTTGGDDGGEVVFADATTDMQSSKPAALMKLFDGGKFPTCPTEDAEYTIQVLNTSGVISFNVKCTSSEAADHNPAAATTTAAAGG